MTKKAENKEFDGNVAPTGVPADTILKKAPNVAGGEEIQATVDKAEEVGYIGVKTDPRPNSDYSQEGGMPVATQGK